jgi:hypothetical protein
MDLLCKGTLVDSTMARRMIQDQDSHSERWLDVQPYLQIYLGRLYCDGLSKVINICFEHLEKLGVVSHVTFPQP